MTSNPEIQETQVPIEVVDGEYVARIIMSPLYFQDGKLGRSAFELRDTKRHPKESYISVNRMSYWNADTEAIKFRPPSGNTICGYAKILVKAIRGISTKYNDKCIDVDVRAEQEGQSSSPHAGIFTKIGGEEVLGGGTNHVSSFWIYVQSQLLKISEYIQLPCCDTSA